MTPAVIRLTAWLELRVTAIGTTGGHWHDGNRPTGYMVPDTGLTNSSGCLYATFIAPVCTCSGNLRRGVAGEYVGWAYSRDDTTIWDSLHIGSGVLGLAELEENETLWVRTGTTNAHMVPFNHCGTPASNQHLEEIASEFHSIMITRGWDIHTLFYNDQSLPFGGLFDIGPPYGQLWDCPHREHDEGRNCDITKYMQAVYDTALGRIIEEHGDTLIPPETYHWHTTFPE